MKGLPRLVKIHLEKARESALLAVDVYNKTGVTFRSGAYIVLMIIAWTAIFQAFFYKNRIKPIFRKQNSRRYQKINKTDYKYWDIGQCLQEYFKSDTQNPVRKNLEFFGLLRNKIEHHSMPEIDADIFGECQAMLLNLNDFIEEQFEKKYSIREALSFSLQFFPSPKTFSQIKKNPFTNNIHEFIKQFRSSVALETKESGKFSFKAYLIQVVNHQGKNTLPVQFLRFDQLTQEQKQQLEKFVILQKPRQTILSDSEFKKMYPLTHKKLLLEMNTRYQDFKTNKKFNALKKDLQKDSKFYGERHLDPDNPRSAKQGFYSNFVFERFNNNYAQK